jgi:rRNA maturation RNase YbeY
MDKAATRDKETVWSSLEVNLMDDSGIAEIKQSVFGRHEITDVVALRYNPLPGMEEGCTAEIFVNIQRAITCRKHTGWDASRELALYLAHGCDHLSGATDDTPAERNTMRRRELRWLKEADQSGMAANLIDSGN